MTLTDKLYSEKTQNLFLRATFDVFFSTLHPTLHYLRTAFVGIGRSGEQRAPEILLSELGELLTETTTGAAERKFMDFVWYLRPWQGLRFDLRSNRGVISERHEDAATQRRRRRRRVDKDGRERRRGEKGRGMSGKG